MTVGELAAHNHTASTDTIANHTHTISVITKGSDQNAGDGGSNYWSDRATSAAGSHSHKVTVANSGSGNAHNNLPPYIGLYVWERTA